MTFQQVKSRAIILIKKHLNRALDYFGIFIKITATKYYHQVGEA